MLKSSVVSNIKKEYGIAEGYTLEPLGHGRIHATYKLYDSSGKSESEFVLHDS